MSKKLKNVTTIIALCVGLILIGTKAYATTAKTLNDKTRLRKKASTNSEIVEIISKDEKVEVVSKEDDWYKVKYNSQVGYVRGDLIEVEEEKKEVAEEAKKEENKTEKASKAEETKTEETQKQDEAENQEEAKKEEESSKEQKVEIKENDQIELKEETQIQLLPIIFSCKTGKVPANTKITVVEVVGNWCHISAGNQEGWLHISKIESSKAEEQKAEENKEEEKKEENKEEKKLYVSTTTLNLREKADTKSDVVTKLSLNDEVTVVKVVNNTWTQVKFKDYEGYTASEYLSDKKVSDTTSRSAQELRNSEEEAAKKKAAEEAAKKKAEEAAKKKAAEEAKKKQEEEEEEEEEEDEEEETSSSKSSSSSKKSGTTGEDIVAYAKKFLGYKYVYGASGPNSFDCSGFTSYVYKHFGYSLNRTSGGQRSNGSGVSKSDLEPGDILCFSGHVGIYIGGNKFIHAANPSKGVIISSLSESYYVKTYITARRIL